MYAFIGSPFYLWVSYPKLPIRTMGTYTQKNTHTQLWVLVGFGCGIKKMGNFELGSNEVHKLLL